MIALDCRGRSPGAPGAKTWLIGVPVARQLAAAWCLCTRALRGVECRRATERASGSGIAWDDEVRINYYICLVFVSAATPRAEGSEEARRQRETKATRVGDEPLYIC